MSMFLAYDLLTSAARTGTTASTVYGSNGLGSLRLFLDVTAASGTGGLIPQLRAHDPQTNAAKLIWATPLPVTATGTYVYEMSESANDALRAIYYSCRGKPPLNFSVTVTHEDGSSYTYSLSAELT